MATMPGSASRIVLVVLLASGLAHWCLATDPPAECPLGARPRVRGIDLSRAEEALEAHEQGLPQFGVGGSVSDLLELVDNMSEEERWLQGDISVDFGLLHRSPLPTSFTPSKNDPIDASSYYQPWDEALAALPGEIERNTVVSYLRDDLPLLGAEACDDSATSECLPDRFLPYAMMLLSYLRQAFIYTRSTVYADKAEGDGPSDVDHSVPVPDAIEIPLKTAARRLGRRSTEFTWADMFTNNVKCLDHDVTFSPAQAHLSRALGCKLHAYTLVASFGKQPKIRTDPCESVFVGITNTQHRYFGKAVQAMAGVYDIVGRESTGVTIAELESLRDYFKIMEGVLLKMGSEFDVMTLKECPIKVWWDKVGVWAQAPPGEYGPNGLQFVPVLAFDTFLRRTYRYSRLGKAQAENLGALPRNHRALLRALQSGPDVPNFITGLKNALVNLDQDVVQKFGNSERPYGGSDYYLYERDKDFPDTGLGKALYETIDSFNSVARHFKEYLSKHNSKAMVYIQDGTKQGKPRGTSGNSGMQSLDIGHVIDHSGGGAGAWNDHDADVVKRAVEDVKENVSDETYVGMASKIIKCGGHALTETARKLSAILYESLEERRGIEVPYNIVVLFTSASTTYSRSKGRIFHVGGNFLPHHKHLAKKIYHGMVANIQPSLPEEDMARLGPALEVWNRVSISDLDQAKWASAMTAIGNPPQCRLSEADAASSFEYRPLGEHTLGQLRAAFENKKNSLRWSTCLESLSSLRPESDWGDVVGTLPAQCLEGSKIYPSKYAQPLKSRKYSLVKEKSGSSDFSLYVMEVDYSVEAGKDLAKSSSSNKKGLVSSEVAPPQGAFTGKKAILLLDPHVPFLKGPFSHFMERNGLDNSDDDSDDDSDNDSDDSARSGADVPWYAEGDSTRQRIVLVISGGLWMLMERIITYIESAPNVDAVLLVMSPDLDRFSAPEALRNRVALGGRAYGSRIRVYVMFTKLEEGSEGCANARLEMGYGNTISVFCRKQGAGRDLHGFNVIDFEPKPPEESPPKDYSLDYLRGLLRPRHAVPPAGPGNRMGSRCYPGQYVDDTSRSTLAALLKHLDLADIHSSQRENLVAWSLERSAEFIEYLKSTKGWHQPVVMSIGSSGLGVALNEFAQNLIAESFESSEDKRVEAMQYIHMLKRLGYWVEETNGGSPATKQSLAATCSDMEELNAANSKQCLVSFLGSIHDISRYVNSGVHPGGSLSLRSFCGKDITEAFGVTGHSIAAAQELATMEIARLVDDGDAPSENRLPTEKLLQSIPRLVNPCGLQALTGRGFVLDSTEAPRVSYHLEWRRSECTSANRPQQVLVVGPVGIYVAWADEAGVHRMTIPFTAIGQSTQLTDDGECVLIRLDGVPGKRVLIFCTDHEMESRDGATMEEFFKVTNSCLEESQWLEMGAIEQREVIRWQLAVNYNPLKDGGGWRWTIMPDFAFESK